MTKTEELEERCVRGLIEAGKLTVLVPDNVMASSVEAQVTLGTVLFPSPSADFGHISRYSKPTAPLDDIDTHHNP